MENFTERVKSELTSSLKEIVLNPTTYRGALIVAAKAELANRGIELTEEEQLIIAEKKNKKKQEARENANPNTFRDFFYKNWNLNIVDDPECPQLYSRQVICVFTLFLSVLFGGILLAINLKTTNNKKAIIPVLIYSILYTALTIGIVTNMAPHENHFTIALNTVGGYFLYNQLWTKYIGKDFNYRTRPYKKPLIVGIIILLIFMLLTLRN